MKKEIMRFLKLIVLLCIANAAIAQTPKSVDSKVVKVTVFPQGAQVIRTARTSIGGGKTELTFSGLSPYTDASSIQVSGEGAFTILSVSPQANVLKGQKKRKEIEEIEKSRDAFQKLLIQHQASLDVYQKEEQMLEANQKIGGENVGIKAADLAAVLDLHRTRLRELKFFEIDYNEKITKVQDTLALINAQINELNTKADVSTTDVTVTVQSVAGSNANFTLSYVVRNAGWYPSYDLHVDDISKPLQLNYKANVYQNTGEEWKDVHLIFSNGNPNESGVAPVLQPHYLRNLLTMTKSSGALSIEDVASQEAGVTQTDANVGITINGSRNDEGQYVVNGHRYLEGKSNVNYGSQTQNSTTITFELATPYTVINDGKNRAVDVKQEEIPATFEYFCVPKKEKKAYLVAHVTNWLDYNLMDGEVNLYYEGTYTGKTAFSLANTEDTLNLSLGQDKGITVNRTQVKEFSKRQLLSDKKVASASFEIAIRNNKKFPINLVIEDQLPVSVEKDITIDNQSYEGAQLEEQTGKLTWKINLEPAKDKKLKLSYTVKYPKSYRVQID
jgi:uncharacterized protein (TIGR02231 family)